jgi:hypothetical protein
MSALHCPEPGTVYTHRMSAHVLQRRDWNGEPVAVGDAFRVHKLRAGRQFEAACHVVTHALGWELRLEVEGSLQRSQVCRTHDEVLDTSEQWKSAMIAKGWQ